MDGHRQQDNISIIHTFLHQVYTFILHSRRRRDFSTTTRIDWIADGCGEFESKSAAQLGPILQMDWKFMRF